MTPAALFPDPAALFAGLFFLALFFLALFVLQTLLSAIWRDWGPPPEPHRPAQPWAAVALLGAIVAIVALAWGVAYAPM